jgi:probable HAF family extracellular repeat protein
MHEIRTNWADLTKVCLVAMGVVVVALLMGAQPVSGQQPAAGQYSLTDLGTLGGGYSLAYDINSRGQVVGISATASGEEHAFLWEDGEMTDLGHLGGGYSQANGINNRGQVVGISVPASGTPHAFFWEDGEMTDLGTQVFNGSEAFGINSRGQVVGFNGTGGEIHAFLWSKEGR